MKLIIFIFLVNITIVFSCMPQAIVPDDNIPLPSPVQLRWQTNEQIMFVHLSPAAWQSREYDDWSTPLSEMHLSKLDTDQWCEVAKLWGAKLILFVAKHAGGFCWWQTNTSDYGIRNIPWKDGKGDVLADLSASCTKNGLDLGIYVYPGDEHWGAGIGSGGITKDTTLQEAYNKVYRQQLMEVLTQYGAIREVWFDGNCNIPVNDILENFATEAVILQSKKANIRWVGNEDGIAPDPNWYTLKKDDLETGVSTALHSDVNGDVYAPVEVDVPFFKNGGHKWFWAPDLDHLLMTQEQLMNLYYKSVGRGSVLLLNSTPDTSGLIPASHVEVYKRFGEEISQRFSNPIKQISACLDTIKIDFDTLTVINHTILQEELNKGQRILAYVIEGSNDGRIWSKLYEGRSVGNKKIDYFASTEIKSIRVCIIKSKGIPQIKNFAVYYVESEIDDISKMNEEKPVIVSTWEASTFSSSEWSELKLDLTRYVDNIGHYDISFATLAYDFTNAASTGLEFKEWKLEMYGGPYPEGIEFLPNNRSFRITRSQQTLSDFPTHLTIKVKSKASKSTGEIMIKRITY